MRIVRAAASNVSLDGLTPDTCSVEQGVMIDRRTAMETSPVQGAINLQLYRRLVSQIVAGHWAPGARLPSSRKLAADNGVSRTTASLALDRLVADGWAIARPRSGLFVADGAQPARNPRTAPRLSSTLPAPFELGQGAVDCFPHARWAKLQARVWSANVPDALYEPEPAGDFGLRRALVRHLALSRGIECAVEDLFIVPSTRAAIALSLATLGDDLAGLHVEDPGYPGVAEAAATKGIECRAVKVDRDGMRVVELPKTGSGRLAYVTPAAQFPTGVLLSDDRRDALEHWAVEGGQWLFEDDYDWDARFDDNRPAPALKAGAASDRVFYCQSLSRALFSSLRICLLVVPAELRERALAARDRGDGAVNLPVQLVLREFIESGAYAAHLRQLRDVYRERRQALLDVVRPTLGGPFEAAVNRAGLRIVLRCSSDIAARAAAMLRDGGLLCSTLSDLAMEDVADDGVVLGFAAFTPEEIRDRGEAFRDILRHI